MRKIALFCALALTACGSPSDAVNFKAPARFGVAKNVMGMVQIWEVPGSHKELLTLIRMPFVADQNKVLQGSNFKEARLQRQEKIKICGNQSATHFVLVKTTEGQRIDAIMSPVGGKTYMAMYGYPEKSTPGKDAETAIRELCVR